MEARETFLNWGKVRGWVPVGGAALSPGAQSGPGPALFSLGMPNDALRRLSHFWHQLVRAPLPCLASSLQDGPGSEAGASGPIHSL